jgi:hypothetical protein
VAHPAAAEAEPPFAATLAVEGEAEVAGRGAPGVGPRRQLGERQRRAGADAEDQLAAGLGEPCLGELPVGGRGGAGEEEEKRRSEADPAQDLARVGDREVWKRRVRQGSMLSALRRSSPQAMTVFREVMSKRNPRRRRCLAAPLVLLALAAIAAAPAPAGAESGGAGGEAEEAPPALHGKTPFDRQGMWIWYVSHSEGGSIPAIVARAKRYGIGTVYIKAGDGGSTWSQFTKSLVGALHRGGLDVCAWQFVYGDSPVAEARVGAAAVEKGADCLVIDAEGDYEGKYAAADRYIRTLRAAIGEGFPLSLAGFPYVDYHPAFPYSVFLGPGGAGFNQPQMYWKAIRTSVRSVYEHTYLYNRLWRRPIYPVGQTYEGPGSTQLRLFRRFAASYGGLQPSWWDWQETAGSEWSALGALSGRRRLSGYRQNFSQPLLKRGSRGDLVVWAQEHLIPAGEEVEVNGIYGAGTYAAVRAFQESHGLTVDGAIGTSTWRALLAFAPYRMRWSSVRSSSGASSSRVARPASRPLSASLPAKAYEVDPGSAP